MGINFVESYENLSDSEIVANIKNGNFEMLSVIIERYYPVILKYVCDYCPQSYKEDAIQEATLALYSAVKSFDETKSSFKTFATLCVKRSVISVLKSRQSQKTIPDELVSPIYDLDIVDSNSPEKIFFDKQDYKALTDSIRLELSALEYRVLELYLSGERYADIADKLSISEKAVDNSLTRIRKKLKA